MVNRIAKWLVVLTAFGLGGCAAGEVVESDEADSIRTTEAALFCPSPKGLVQLHAEAVQLTDGRVIVDLAFTDIPRPPTEADEEPLHDTGEFFTVLVYRVAPDGWRTPIAILTRKDIVGPNAIGPGGGCIHFFVPAKAGDRLFIGGVVKPTGQGLSIGATPVFTVQGQIEGSPVGQWPFAPLGDDHTLPPP